MLKALMTAVLAVPLAMPLLAAPTPAAAQAEKSTPPARIRSILLEPGKKCPESTAEEVIVCSPIDQPYRIPKELRNDRPIPPVNQSWAARAATIDQVGRTAGGLPNTCSAVGTGGQTGCTQQLIQQWLAERAQQRREGPKAP